jgi:hypothetical protein
MISPVVLVKNVIFPDKAAPALVDGCYNGRRSSCSAAGAYGSGRVGNWQMLSEQRGSIRNTNQEFTTKNTKDTKEDTTGNQEIPNRKAGKQESRKSGNTKQESRKTGKQENRKAGKRQNRTKARIQNRKERQIGKRKQERFTME